MKAQQTTAGPQEHDHTTTGGQYTEAHKHTNTEAETRTRTERESVGGKEETGQLNGRTAKTHRQEETGTGQEGEWERVWEWRVGNTEDPTMWTNNKIHGN
ncbi:LOW QUALITY PROTEIN: uncharacterized protein LOC117186443 [Drosophila miranda]|uniref:LOW QUALITY PROTEIN: uncharacterized protein LOC117186443 n=1 Tax=Drosophila miranda TaxID=7229 RepID=UPI00143FAB41|nr:LOW QUALITY PROTEIN: uncharacterized protein LOC117186443 [Drosophila miranda]